VAIRESNVTDNYVSGEFLNYLRNKISAIYGSDNQIAVGSSLLNNVASIPALTLHSIVLLSALEISKTFQKDTLSLSNLLPAIFNSNLYFVDPYDMAASLANKSDFLTKLLNDQISLGSNYADPNGLLLQFASDVAKIPSGIAITNDTLDNALITSVIEDYNYMANGFTKAFFTRNQWGQTRLICINDGANADSGLEA
jgi:hypothetical protein